MKKRIFGILLLSLLLFSACGNEKDKDKEAETANSKVEQLESRVKELESSSSSEEVESKYSEEEIKTYLDKDYNNEYTKEFINKAYKEGILLFYNGQLGVYESDYSESYGPNGFLIGFFLSQNDSGNNVDCLITKYGNAETFEDEYLRIKKPDEYLKKYPNYLKTTDEKKEFVDSYNRTVISIQNIDERVQEKLVSIFNSFK